MRPNPSPRTLRARESGLLSLLAIRASFGSCAPTLEEIATHLDMKSKGSAARLVRRMTRSGAITRTDSRARGSRSGELVLVEFQI